MYVWFTYLHEDHKSHPNVGEYTMTMDGMGIVGAIFLRMDVEFENSHNDIKEPII